MSRIWLLVTRILFFIFFYLIYSVGCIIKEIKWVVLNKFIIKKIFLALRCIPHITGYPKGTWVPSGRILRPSWASVPCWVNELKAALFLVTKMKWNKKSTKLKYFFFLPSGNRTHNRRVCSGKLKSNKQKYHSNNYIIA